MHPSNPSLLILPRRGIIAAAGGIAFLGTDAQSVDPGFASGNFTVNIGTASADRIVIMGFQVHTGSGMTLPTLNGTTMLVAAGNTTTADNVALLYLAIASGTTATLAYVGGANGISFTAGILTGQSGGAGATSSNGNAYTAGGVQPLSLANTVPAGGMGIIVAGVASGAASPTYTWTGTTSVAGDEATGITNSQCGMSHATASATMTASSSSTLSSGGTMAYASWGP